VYKECGEDKDLPYGRFNQPRPDVTLDKGNPISWGPKKGRSKSLKDKISVAPPKLKVGEMRDYLATRVAVTTFRGMKKKELTALYLSEKSKDVSSPSSSSTSTPDSSPSPTLSADTECQNENIPSSDVAKPEDEVDDGTGCGLHLEPLDCPKTVSDFKVLFDNLGIDYSGLSGGRAYKEAYSNYLSEKEIERKAKEEQDLKEKEEQEQKEKEGASCLTPDTERMSDDEDDEDDVELGIDNNSYDEICWEGVVYYEDEETGKIYNVDHLEVGKWNSDMDDIIWSDQKYKEAHENHPR
jgi:hypothetical protein